MTKKILPLVLLGISLSGCGKFLDKFDRLSGGGYTEVRVDGRQHSLKDPGLIRMENPIETLVELAGGVMVYARNTSSGQVFSTKGASETDSEIRLLLPFGNYEFYSVGWPTANLTGTPGSTSRVRCGYGPSKDLSTLSETVNIDLTNLALCNSDTFFTPSLAAISSPWPSLASLKIVPCGRHVDISSKTAADDCDGTETGSYFFKGDPADIQMGRGEFFPNSNVLMLSATNENTITPFGLFRRNLSTGQQTRIGINHAGIKGVKALKRVPNREQLLFLLEAPASYFQLWLYKLTDGSLHRLDNASPANGSTFGPQEFRVSDDGNYVVYVSDQDTANVMELYSVPLNGTSYPAAPPKISGVSSPLVNLGVFKCTSCGDDKQFRFDIKPGSTNPYVIFSGTKENSYSYHLHIASLTGSSFTSSTINGAGPTAYESGTKINGSEISANPSRGDEFGFSADGNHLIYHANDAGTDSVHQIDISYDGTAVTSSAPIALLASGADSPWFAIGHTNKAMALGRIPGAPDNLFAKMLDMTNPAGTIHLSHQFALANNNYRFSQIEFKADDSKVVYSVQDFTTPASPIAKQLFADTVTTVDNTATNTSVDLSNGQVSGAIKLGHVSTLETLKSFVLDSTGTKVLFTADIAGVDIMELYYANITGGANATKISPAAINTVARSVKSFNAYSNGKAYFNADTDDDTFEEMWMSAISATPAPATLALPSGIKRVTDVSDSDEDITSGFPIMARPNGAPSVDEPYLFTPSTNSFTRMATLSGGVDGSNNPDNLGAGRLQVRWMMNRTGSTPETAFISDCQSYSASIVHDGSAIDTTVRVPIGNGTQNRFPVEIDIFPLATSCSGSAVTYSFPNGLMGAPASGSVYGRIDGDGSASGNLKLFLREK